MKKAIALIGVMTAVFMFVGTRHAHAYTYDIGGQVVSGYVRDVVPSPGPEQAFVEKAERPAPVQIDVFGNTRIYDFLKAINPTDVDLFLQIVKRAGIRY